MVLDPNVGAILKKKSRHSQGPFFGGIVQGHHSVDIAPVDDRLDLLTELFVRVAEEKTDALESIFLRARGSLLEKAVKDRFATLKLHRCEVGFKPLEQPQHLDITSLCSVKNCRKGIRVCPSGQLVRVHPFPQEHLCKVNKTSLAAKLKELFALSDVGQTKGSLPKQDALLGELGPIEVGVLGQLEQLLPSVLLLGTAPLHFHTVNI